ncbi:MAG: hypothetical protein JSU96_16480 [Acidobacteriota bacterium]|nr:MAG: hypothetical protein JSU96_16480 [Acidobacteriota bacterium]
MSSNYFNYFTEIEEHFVQKRGRNLLISPLDWCLIELWKEQGIPLHVVLRGIDRSFESADEKRKKAPRTLYYCHPAVTDAFEEYQESMIGESEEQSDSEISSGEVRSFIRAIQESLADREEEPFFRARQRLAALEEELSRRKAVDPEQVDQDLGTIGRDLIAELADSLGVDEVKQLRSECASELKIYKRRVSKDVFSKLEQKQFERRMRERFELPAFSLLDLDT